MHLEHTAFLLFRVLFRASHVDDRILLGVVYKPEQMKLTVIVNVDSGVADIVG